MARPSWVLSLGEQVVVLLAAVPEDLEDALFFLGGWLALAGRIQRCAGTFNDRQTLAKGDTAQARYYAFIADGAWHCCQPGHGRCGSAFPPSVGAVQAGPRHACPPSAAQGSVPLAGRRAALGGGVGGSRAY